MKKIIKTLGVIIIIGVKLAFAGNIQDKNYQIGIASYYSIKHENKRTASGELYRSNELTAAHKSFEFGSLVKVTNLSNGKFVIVKINDRGPFVKGRLIDLSYSAAKEIDMIRSGMAKVKIEKIDFVDNK